MLVNVIVQSIVETLRLYVLHANVRMSSAPDSVGDGVMFSGRPSAAFVRSFVRLSGQVLLPRCLMNGLSNLDETYRECSSARTDDQVRF